MFYFFQKVIFLDWVWIRTDG